MLECMVAGVYLRTRELQCRLASVEACLRSGLLPCLVKTFLLTGVLACRRASLQESLHAGTFPCSGACTKACMLASGFRGDVL